MAGEEVDEQVLDTELHSSWGHKFYKASLGNYVTSLVFIWLYLGEEKDAKQYYLLWGVIFLEGVWKENEAKMLKMIIVSTSKEDTNT